ncbi:MAG: hypothetical protein NDF54_11025 [archaeon GB-1867-035]|nr:hypothetical protein [Candidatus Culexmicrobium profundum]
MSSYNRMAYEKRYRKVYEEGVEFWEEPIPTEEPVEFIEKEFPHGRIRVIDLGCGEGRNSIFLAEKIRCHSN